MKYKIKEILPGQIKVEFEDESWAIVGIDPHASVEEIDDAVSKYDKDFLPDPETRINPNIFVGEERVSKTLSVSENSSQIESQEPSLSTPKVEFGVANPFEVLVGAQYYAENGDNRLKDALYSNFEQFISDPRYSFDELINSILSDPDGLVEKAKEESNNILDT